MDAAIARPWYRHFWVWFMLAPLIAAVTASFATLFIAGREPALVVDDFGQIAMAIEKDQDRDRRALALGVTAELRFGAGGEVEVRIAGVAPESVRLELIHPTLERMDRSVMLGREGDTWRGAIERADTRLYLQVTDEAGGWRLTGELPRSASTARLGPRG
jgi:hypothetical protein